MVFRTARLESRAPNALNYHPFFGPMRMLLRDCATTLLALIVTMGMAATARAANRPDDNVGYKE